MSLALALLVAAPQTTTSLKPGAIYRYRVVVTQTEYEGAGSKVKERNVTEMPIELRATGARSLDVAMGPLFARGRSVGRARKSSATLGGPKLPSWLTVPLPFSGFKPGQRWQGPLSAPAPLPAGMIATYVCRANAKGLAQVGVSVKQSGNSRLVGSGNLFVDSKTGIPHHGWLLFDVAFLRPDMKDRSKMVVNSHMTVECVVRPK